MPGKFDGETCPVCGVGTLHDDVRQAVLEYRGERFAADQSGAYCDKCNEGVIYFDPSIEERWEKFRADVEAKQAHELSSIRSRLKITQELASRLSGGGHNAFSRYERQEVVPVLAVVNLFRLLSNDPSRIIELIPGSATTTLVTSGTFMISLSHVPDDEEKYGWGFGTLSEQVLAGIYGPESGKYAHAMGASSVVAKVTPAVGRVSKRLVPRTSKVAYLKPLSKQA